MLQIKYLDKKRFMEQVAASRGSVYLHLDDGTVCDLKHSAEAAAMLRTMDAPRDGLSISLAEPADVRGFVNYMLEAGRPALRTRKTVNIANF